MSLLEALRADAGGLVDGARVGSADGLPDVGGLSAARADAVRSAWTGSRLHAGEDGLLGTGGDADLALLVGDWCFAHALRLLAAGEDLGAIGELARAIGSCAATLGDGQDGQGRRDGLWAQTCIRLGAPGAPERATLAG